MKDDIKRQLDEASTNYGKKMENAKHTEIQKKQVQDESYDQFLAKAKPTVLAALTEMGEYLKKQGHDYKISQNDKMVDKMGVLAGASITMDIYPKIDKSIVTQNLDKHPSITYAYNIRSKKVQTYVQEYMPGSGSGSSGPDMEIPLGEITEENVQKRVARLIKENFEKWQYFSF